MPRSSFNDTFNKFFGQMNWYTNFLTKIANTTRVMLTLSEKREVLEAFVPKVYVTREILVRDLLVACLSQDTSQYAIYKNTRLPACLSRNVCNNLISGAGYFNFKDTADIRGKARQILVYQYNPFDNKHDEIKQVKDDLKSIDEFRVIRNYLVHYSGQSKQKLHAIYKSKYSLQEFCEPGKFLSTLGKGKIHFLNYTHAFFNTADAMAQVLKVN